MRAIHLVELCALSACVGVGCGAGGSLETLSDASYDGAGCDSGDGGLGHDAIVGDAMVLSDAVFLDHGTNGVDPDAALPRCTTNEDCSGWATCQSGLCCSGVIVGNVCTCGAGAGCDLRHACCVPFASTTKQDECVADCASACGCGAAR